MERVCLFIDGSGFYFGLKRNNRVTRVDYYQLSKALTGSRRELVTCFYYNSGYDETAFADKAKAQRSFFDSLDKTPQLETRIGRLVLTREGGWKEKGTDLRMAADMIFFAAQNRYDTALVLTEDATMASAFQQVMQLGRHVEIGCFKDGQVMELIRSADRTVILDGILEKFASKIFAAEVRESPDGRY